MSYLDNIFVNNIDKNKINTIFELGSRDLLDAIKLFNYYNCKIYSFECNPDCLVECNKNLLESNDTIKKNIQLIDKAVSITNNDIFFYPFDLTKYDNMGSSSLLKITFKNRNIDDPDYNKENPQTEITVKGIRLDTFMFNNNISNIDLLCIDLQGYELNALKSLDNNLYNVKYIIVECSISNTYIGGCSFVELNDYLTKYNFKYVCSDVYHYNFPNLSATGFSEFNCLFMNSNI
jgi:FkbM family methyltransferase